MELISVRKLKEPLREFPMHHLPYWMLILNLTGSGTMKIGEELYDFHPGDIFIMPPGTPHGKRSAEGFTDICIAAKDMRSEADANVKQITDDANGTIRNLMELALKIYENQPNYSPERVATILNSLIVSIYQILAAMLSHNLDKNINIDRFIERMEVNISNLYFDVGKEIEKYGYNVVYFRRIFKNTVGESPVSYMNRLRIEYAKQEFAQFKNQHTVKEVALSSGFGDPYYFSRVFKNMTGVSPRDYIRNLSMPDSPDSADS